MLKIYLYIRRISWKLTCTYIDIRVRAQRWKARCCGRCAALIGSFSQTQRLRRKFKHAYWPQAFHIQTKECNIPWQSEQCFACRCVISSRFFPSLATSPSLRYLKICIYTYIHTYVSTTVSQFTQSIRFKRPKIA